MHYVLELANQRQLVYQFHTGLQEGIGNHISWSDPTLMTNLFLEYPDVRFDLFHIAYPFHQKLSALAKNFANVLRRTLSTSKKVKRVGRGVYGVS